MQGLWPRTISCERQILYEHMANAGSRFHNAMTCRRTGYENDNLGKPESQIYCKRGNEGNREEKNEKPKKKSRTTEGKRKMLYIRS